MFILGLFCWVIAFVIYWFGMRYDVNSYSEYTASTYSVDKTNIGKYSNSTLNEYTLVFNQDKPSTPPVYYKNESTYLKSKLYPQKPTPEDLSGNFIMISNVQLNNHPDLNRIDENIDKTFTVYCKKDLPLNSHNCSLPMASNNGSFMVSLVSCVSLIIAGFILIIPSKVEVKKKNDYYRL